MRDNCLNRMIELVQTNLSDVVDMTTEVHLSHAVGGTEYSSQSHSTVSTNIQQLDLIQVDIHAVFQLTKHYPRLLSSNP